MSAPDHWATLAILGRTASWNRSRLLGVSLAAGIGHVLLSVALGFVVVALGYVFSRIISFYITEAIGAIMVIAGGYSAGRAILNREKALHEHLRDSKEKAKKMERGAGYFAVLGAALSPDLSILPIFLLAVPVGLSVAIDTALVFALASILTIVLLVLGSSAGLAVALERIPQEYNEAVAGFVIALIGVYILIVG
jgi:hypothetical protein